VLPLLLPLLLWPPLPLLICFVSLHWCYQHHCRSSLLLVMIFAVSSGSLSLSLLIIWLSAFVVGVVYILCSSFFLFLLVCVLVGGLSLSAHFLCVSS
jgi:hypothetical protein